MDSSRMITFQDLLRAMDLSEDRAEEMFRNAHVQLTEELRENRRSLTSREVEKLRAAVFRSYRPLPKPPEPVVQAQQEPEPEQPEPAENPPKAPEPENEQPESEQAPQQPHEPEPEQVPPPENEMDRIVMQNVIMIDTCSWMHSMCGKMVDELLPSLKRYGKKIILPERVRQELLKHRDNVWDAERADHAREGWKQCQRLQDAGCLRLKGSEQDNFADNAFFVQFSNYRMRHSMLLITQDNALTYDILQLNTIGSGNGYPIRVMRITSSGTLTDAQAYPDAGS